MAPHKLQSVLATAAAHALTVSRELFLNDRSGAGEGTNVESVDFSHHTLPLDVS